MCASFSPSWEELGGQLSISLVAGEGGRLYRVVMAAHTQIEPQYVEKAGHDLRYFLNVSPATST